MEEGKEPQLEYSLMQQLEETYNIYKNACAAVRTLNSFGGASLDECSSILRTSRSTTPIGRSGT
jgi:hypothetical protein